MPYAQATSARIRQARPSVGIAASLGLGLGLVLGELRRALRDQRVLLADEDRALPAHRDDDLAVLPERVGHRAGVPDGDRRRSALAVAHPEVERVAPARVARDDLASQLVGAPGVGARKELAGALGR